MPLTHFAETPEQSAIANELFRRFPSAKFTVYDDLVVNRPHPPGPDDRDRAIAICSLRHVGKPYEFSIEATGEWRVAFFGAIEGFLRTLT